MAEEKKQNNIRVITYRPEGQKREYSTFVELNSNPAEVTLRFCDLKPTTTQEELEKIQKEGKVSIPINTEKVLPFVVAEALASSLRIQLDAIKAQTKKGANNE